MELMVNVDNRIMAILTKLLNNNMVLSKALGLERCDNIRRLFLVSAAFRWSICWGLKEKYAASDADIIPERNNNTASRSKAKI